MFHVSNFSKRTIEFTYSRFCSKGFTACDFPVETGDFPVETGEFPLDSMAVALIQERLQLWLCFVSPKSWSSWWDVVEIHGDWRFSGGNLRLRGGFNSHWCRFCRIVLFIFKMDLGLEIELYIGGLSRRGRAKLLRIPLTSSLIEKVTEKNRSWRRWWSGRVGRESQSLKTEEAALSKWADKSF